jgi:hypothetical protein
LRFFSFFSCSASRFSCFCLSFSLSSAFGSIRGLIRLVGLFFCYNKFSTKSRSDKASAEGKVIFGWESAEHSYKLGLGL